VNGDVEAKKFNKRRIATKTKEGRQVMRVIFREIDGRQFALPKNIAIYTSSNIRKLGDTLKI
jgi:hypothetical protein